MGNHAFFKVGHLFRKLFRCSLQIFPVTSPVSKSFAYLALVFLLFQSTVVVRSQLLVNPSKTTFIIFGSKAMVSKIEDFCLSLLGKVITPTACAKHLAVILDSFLTYNDHIALIASTISCIARLGQTNRVKHAFDKLYYCCNVWSKTSEHNLSGCRLFKILQPVSLAVQRNMTIFPLS